MNLKLGSPVRELDLTLNFFNEAYMARLFPDGIGSRQQAIPKREEPANDANPYQAHRQGAAA